MEILLFVFKQEQLKTLWRFQEEHQGRKNWLTHDAKKEMPALEIRAKLIMEILQILISDCAPIPDE